MATSNCGTDPIPCIENVLVTGLVRGFVVVGGGSGGGGGGECCMLGWTAVTD